MIKPFADNSSRLEKANFAILFNAIKTDGYRIIGPKIENNTIVYREISTPEDLPRGWIDRQDGGTYRLEKSGADAYFGYVVGPDSPKKVLFSPERKLWSIEKNLSKSNFTADRESFPKTAFLGIRPCELAAIAIQDKIFMEGEYADPDYRNRRESSILIAVNCTRAGGTCFCTSMGTGPKADSGFDIALTEVGGDDGFFLIEGGSGTGRGILETLRLKAASENDISAAGNALESAAQNMGRKLETSGLPELLQAAFDNPRLDQVASRCLTCGNCTMVCPTCFCSTVIDSTDLAGGRAERIRRWDSCFNVEHSYIHGGYVRTSPMSRYRQWITHKLSGWVEQFGMSGCVGCGRCITWCPVGIDITEEARAIRSSVKEIIKTDKG